jgi:hypothetical protein
MLAASSSVVAFLIQNVAIAHPKTPKVGQVGWSDRLRPGLTLIYRQAARLLAKVLRGAKPRSSH